MTAAKMIAGRNALRERMALARGQGSTLRRVEQKFVDLTLADVKEDGVFSGYASLFDTVDLGRDVVAPGAFARSVRRRGVESVRMLFQHDPNQPIGRWLDIREDARGLFVRGKLTPGVARSDDLLKLMRAGALDGLSIGFKTVRSKKQPDGTRRILEADLWEISVVTFPMLPGARIQRLKSLPLEERISSAAEWLRTGMPGHWRRELRLAERMRQAAMRMKQKEWN